MKSFIPRSVRRTALGFLATASVLVFTGCVTAESGPRRGYRGPPPPPQIHAAVVFQDDYDYYPGYETYYSRNRREYVYYEGGAWVRRSEPRGVSASVLIAAPSVRLDFHDSPDHHHNTVIRSYPKNWRRPDNRNDERKNDRDEHRDDNRK